MARGANRLRAAFLDPRERAPHRDWAQATVSVVAQSRGSAGPAADDPRPAVLVGELSLKSDRFRSLWARHDVHRRESEISRMRHPEVGALDLYRDKLTVNGTDGQLLVVYHAKPGSESARSLTRLAPLTAADAAGRLRPPPGAPDGAPSVNPESTTPPDPAA